MSTKKSSIAALAVAAFTFCMSANATVYHLICRGGATGNTRLDVQNYSGVNNELTSYITYIFERYAGPKASIKKDGSHLAPGQCSWATDLVRAGYNYFSHSIDNSGIATITSVTPIITSDNRQASASTQGLIIPDHSDPSQAYLPWFSPSNPAEQLDGTILDQRMVFHFYMSIKSDNSLQFHSLTSAVQLF